MSFCVYKLKSVGMLSFAISSSIITLAKSEHFSPNYQPVRKILVQKNKLCLTFR